MADLDQPERLRFLGCEVRDSRPGAVFDEMGIEGFALEAKTIDLPA